MIESIKRTGRYSKMPGNGLLIWHMDKNGNKNYQDMTPSMHYQVSVEQADGKFHLEKNSGDDKYDLFFDKTKDSFTALTTPNSKWWDGSIAPLSITNINSDGTGFTYSRSMPTDITSDGIITVDDTSSPEGQGSSNAFDNNLKTKWLIRKSNGSIQYSFKDEAEYAVTSYAISSANDYAQRDPKSWTLSGSNDNLNWDILDNRSEEDFSDRFQTKHYSIDNTKTYKHYKLTISNHSGNKLQLSEINLYGFKGSAKTIAASGENSDSGEGMDKAFDNNTTTKWLTFQNSGWISYYFNKPVSFSQYSITSANDASSRDPKSWKLYASNDNENWVLLNSQINQSFEARRQKKFYPIKNSDKFAYYKLDVNSTNGASKLQISELQFFDISAGNENSPKDVKENAFDNNTDTKWLSFRTKDAISIMYMNPLKINSYAITSADDSPERDPKSWTVLGSNDNKTWDKLDTKTGEVFSERFQRKLYNLNTTQSYLYYKFDITENNGGNEIQLAEIEYLP